MARLVGTNARPIYARDKETDFEDQRHVCDGGASKIAAEWLDRQKLLGLISPKGIRAVEQLIEDLR